MAYQEKRNFDLPSIGMTSASESEANANANANANALTTTACAFQLENSQFRFG